jgi:hypothetical protein
MASSSDEAILIFMVSESRRPTGSVVTRMDQSEGFAPEFFTTASYVRPKTALLRDKGIETSDMEDKREV